MALAGIFIVVNFLSLKSGKLKGMHSTDRVTYGTVYFPIAFLILATFFWEKPITLILSMLVMSLSDTATGISGSKADHPRIFTLWKDSKTLEGSTVMFLTTFLIVYVGTDFFAWIFGAAFFIPLPNLISLAGFVAMMATLAEAVSCEGSDNLSVPLVAAITYELYLINYTHGTLPIFMLWTVGSGIIFLYAFKLRTLSASGTAGAFLMGVLVFGVQGVYGIVPLLTFFLLSSFLSKIGNKQENTFQKGSQRDIIQVLANGGVGMLILLWNFFYPFEGAYLIFLGSIAAATADTWATEIGFFSRSNPRKISTFKQVEKGTSGGVTLIGTFGSFLGAGVIAGVGLLLGVDPELFWIITAAGFIGSIADSILGGTVQARFYCKSCEKETEKRRHCSGVTQHVNGFKWMDNDMVNFLNTITGAVVTYFSVLI
jgi:uncharacterized protein (TIGR00297 family)